MPICLPCYEAGLDAVIVQDMGVMRFIRRNFPGLPIHASTQMTVTGPAGMKFLESQGAARVVAARELSLAELFGYAQDKPDRNRGFCPWCTLLQLLRPMSDEQSSWRKKRKPRKVRTALPAAVPNQ